MNLSLPFLGSGGLSKGFTIDALINEISASVEVPEIDAYLKSNDANSDKINFNVENYLLPTNIQVTAPLTGTVCSIDNNFNVQLTSYAYEIDNTFNFSIPVSTDKIDNNFYFMVDMVKGDGFPVYMGSLSTYITSAAQVSISSNVTKKSPTYLTGAVYPFSDINVDMYAENYITKYDQTVEIESVVDSSGLMINIGADAIAKQGTRIDIDGFALPSKEINIELSADVIGVDVLLECLQIPEDQIIYKVADIDRNLTDGKAIIHPNEWTPVVVNVPVTDDGKMATVSNYFIPKIKEKYGDNIHELISMIVARDPVTGKEFNYVISSSYTTPEGSYNDFRLCYIDGDKFRPVPFLVKSVTNETLIIDWNN